MALRRFGILRISYRFCDRKIGSHIMKYISRKDKARQKTHPMKGACSLFEITNPTHEKISAANEATDIKRYNSTNASLPPHRQTIGEKSAVISAGKNNGFFFSLSLSIGFVPIHRPLSISHQLIGFSVSFFSKKIKHRIGNMHILRLLRRFT